MVKHLDFFPYSSLQVERDKSVTLYINKWFININLSEYVYWTCIESWIGLFWYLSVCLRRSVSAARSRRGRGGGRLACCPFFPSEKTQYRAHIVHSNLLSLNFYSCSFMNHMFSPCLLKWSQIRCQWTLSVRETVVWFCVFGNGCVWLYDCTIYAGLLTRGRDAMMSHCCWWSFR